MKYQSPNKDIKVSIIEDAVDFNKTLEMMINQAEGMSCISTFFDGETACRQIPGDPPDIVLVDLGLPGMSGIECIGRLKATLPRLQFLVLTIKDQEEEIFGALKAGASGYLLKTSSPSDIITGIKALFDGGAPMSTNIARKVVGYFQDTKREDRPYEDLLTSREKEVLYLLSKGRFYKEIATELFISIETVKSHCRNIYEKLHVSSKTEAINKYYHDR